MTTQIIEATACPSIFQILEDASSYKEFFVKYPEALKSFTAQRPLGLTKLELGIPLTNHSNIFATCLEKLPSLLFERRAEWEASEDTSDEQLLQKHGHDLTLQALTPHLTFGEISQLAHELADKLKLRFDMSKHPYHRYFRKINDSSEEWGQPKLSWGQLLVLHKTLMDFEFADGFDVTIDYTKDSRTSGSRQKGFSIYTKDYHEVAKKWDGTWLDSSMALVVSLKDKHVLTVGICPTAAGLLVNQIQLKTKKGNRWLYKLPAPHFEYALSQLLNTCEANGVNLFLINGQSARALNKSAWGGKSLQAEWDAENGERVERTYDQSLTTLLRSEASLTANDFEYNQITRA